MSLETTGTQRDTDAISCSVSSAWIVASVRARATPETVKACGVLTKAGPAWERLTARRDGL